MISISDKKITRLEGYIISETTTSENTQSFIFENNNQKRFLVRTEKYIEYNYGDKILISGIAKIPKNFENDNDITFNYQKYLLKDKILYTVFYPDINTVEEKSKKDFYYYIFSFKKFFVEKAQKIFSKETSSFVLGVLIGSKNSIDKNLEDNFRKSGLIHILVLSGFNLTVIVYFVFKLFKKFHRIIRFVFSFMFIFCFTILAGGGATIVRASIMISIFLLGLLIRRNNNTFNAILLAGSIMIYLSPIILLYDPSFQLSFVATMGLVGLSKYLEKIMLFITPKFSLREIIVSNITVQFMVVPLLIYQMGEFSIISLIPNIIILPIIPFFMLISFLSIFISLFSKILSMPLIFCTEIISKMILKLVTFFGELPFSVIKIQIQKPQIIIAVFIFYFVLILFLKIKENFIEKQMYSYLRSSSN